MSFFEVMPASEEQLEEICGLEQEAFSHPWGKASLIEQLHNENAVFLAAVNRFTGAVCGFGLVRFVLDSGDLEEIAVDSSCRNKGVGAALLQRLEQSAALQGVQTITLEVRRSNETAVALYEKAGYEQISLRKRYYRDPVEDALIYQKQITEDKIH